MLNALMTGLDGPGEILAPAQPSGRILIVDDVPDNRDILTRRLRRRAFETMEASDGLEALRLLETETFDVVLLDVMMPNISGIEVLQRIRTRFSPSVLPVIMVTAKGETSDIVDALDLGANDYVTKPINFAVVLARVTSQIERRRTASALQRSNEVLHHTNARLIKVNEQLRDEISRRHESDEKSTYLAYHDSLTGLGNRHACDERLPELLRLTRMTGKGLAVLFLDLDGFKNVNDALGHAIGDALLRDIASAMHGAVESSDFLIRLGGDEFCVLHVSDDPLTSAAKLGETLIHTISKDRVVEGQQIFIGASVGIAVADDDVTDSTELLKRADLAMYRAKADGRGVWRPFQSGMDESVRYRRTVELDLRDALARGEFELFYQPIVDLEKDRISGFEALLRWNRRSRGYLPPDKFIGLAEETGLIVPIGDWVLRRACEDAATWPSDLRVAVNVSPVQFRNKHLLTSLLNTLASSRLAPERLELEITESVLLHNSTDNLQVLRECRELGVRLSMDDFGTGYSSLGYFRSFQFDKVKIDRSFISEIAEPNEGRAIVRAVIGLGRSFGMTTLAEGVETKEQLEFLREEGCREVQGFLFGAAQPATKVSEVLMRYGEARDERAGYAKADVMN